MSRETQARPPSASPCRSNPSSHAAASTAAHTARSPDRDIAADAYATAPPNESDSFPGSPHLYKARPQRQTARSSLRTQRFSASSALVLLLLLITDNRLLITARQLS